MATTRRINPEDPTTTTLVHGDPREGCDLKGHAWLLHNTPNGDNDWLCTDCGERMLECPHIPPHTTPEEEQHG